LHEKLVVETGDTVTEGWGYSKNRDEKP